MQANRIVTAVGLTVIALAVGGQARPCHSASPCCDGGVTCDGVAKARACQCRSGCRQRGCHLLEGCRGQCAPRHDCCETCEPACDFCEDFWHSKCDLIQHHAYYPESHGYYYYQAYNYSQLATKQAFVEQWGGDPRNPFSFELFERVKQELEEEDAASLRSQWEILPPAAPKVPRRELPE